MSRYSIYKNLILEDERSSKFKFNIDNRVYYVYRVTDIETKEYYYGSRIQVKETIEDDFWFYCTSSKKKQDILENPQKYKLKVIKVLDNSDDMMIYESFLHQYFDVKSNKNFWNGSNQTPFGFSTAGLHPINLHNSLRKGISWGNHTEKAKRKISDKAKKAFSNNVVKDKISNTLKEYYKNNPNVQKDRARVRKEKGTDKNQTKYLIIEFLDGSKIRLFGQKALKDYCELNEMSFKKMKSSIDRGLIIINDNDNRTTKESKKCKNLKIYKEKNLV